MGKVGWVSVLLWVEVGGEGSVKFVLGGEDEFDCFVYGVVVVVGIGDCMGVFFDDGVGVGWCNGKIVLCYGW